MTRRRRDWDLRRLLAQAHAARAGDENALDELTEWVVSGWGRGYWKDPRAKEREERIKNELENRYPGTPLRRARTQEVKTALAQVLLSSAGSRSIGIKAERGYAWRPVRRKGVVWWVTPEQVRAEAARLPFTKTERAEVDRLSAQVDRYEGTSLEAAAEEVYEQDRNVLAGRRSLVELFAVAVSLRLLRKTVIALAEADLLGDSSSADTTSLDAHTGSRTEDDDAPRKLHEVLGGGNVEDTRLELLTIERTLGRTWDAAAADEREALAAYLAKDDGGLDGKLRARNSRLRARLRRRDPALAEDLDDYWPSLPSYNKYSGWLLARRDADL